MMNVLECGSKIKVKHQKTGNFINYRLVVERLSEDYYRLINEDSHKIMSGFKTTNKEDIVKYIEKALKCEIISIK